MPIRGSLGSPLDRALGSLFKRVSGTGRIGYQLRSCKEWDGKESEESEHFLDWDPRHLLR